MDVRNSGAGSPFLLLGDHAGRAVPRSLGGLGLSKADLLRHIAWDIGVAELGASLADRLGATFISQRYSRLVIDCNRSPAREDSIAAESDGTRIPGNLGLSRAARRARREEIFDPYHHAIAAELDLRAARRRPTRLVSLHSFTPAMDGIARPWRYGVLHQDDSPFSRTALHALSERAGAEAVGDNQPYRMDAADYTVPHHCRARGLDYLELEVRQDLLAAPELVEAEAVRIEAVLRAVS